MTDSIPLSELGASDTTRRDQWGRYLIVPPGGGKPVGYTRVTTVAKALDSGGGLADWKATMAATGMLMRRGLRSRMEALLALYGNPWYGGELAKAECKKWVEEAAAVGGANDRKELGSSMHTLTALIDVGRSPVHLSEETERDLTAYVEGRQAAGVEVVPGMIELTVVIDDYQVAGTLDRLATVPGFDLPLIADLKTSANLEYSWQSIAVQLASYSRANSIYIQGPATDGSEDQRIPMPAVDQYWGLIFWLPADAAHLQLHLVNLEQGWEAFSHSMWARSWRNADVHVPLGDRRPTQDGELEEALAASLAAHPATAPPEEPQPGTSEAGREWLQGRINAIGHHDQARADLGQRWPQDLPTLRASDGHTPEQLAVIEQLLDDVEARYELPFGAPRPVDPVGQLLHLFAGSILQNQPTDKEPA